MKHLKIFLYGLSILSLLIIVIVLLAFILVQVAALIFDTQNLAFGVIVLLYVPFIPIVAYAIGNIAFTNGE